MLAARLTAALDALGLAWEVVFVDDGSHDTTFAQLEELHRHEPRFKAIALSRNFGHQAAICAGLHHATGDAVGIMDADLQDPPEILAACLEKLKQGHDVVYAIRQQRKENLLMRAAYAIFYRLLRAVAEADIPLDSGDFCVMNRRVVNVLKQMPERNIFMRGLRAWTGFRQIGLEYERPARAAGETKYPLSKLMRLAADGLFAFSTLPLRAATYLGFAALAFSTIATGFIVTWRVLGFRFMGHTASELPGWTALVGGMFFLGGIQFLILGCIGEYVGRIYNEIKHRPRWIVREAVGIPAMTDEAAPPNP